MSSFPIYRKTRAFPPQGFFPSEAAGLRWMAQAQTKGGPRVAKVVDVTEEYLDIERITPSRPTAQSSYAFGAALAHMHDAGADCFGCPPANYHGPSYFGPLQDPVPVPTGSWNSVADWYANARLLPMVKLAIDRGALDTTDYDTVQSICDSLDTLLGDAKDDSPARVHGDLWSGNLMWTSQNGSTEAVLIDPAAHGGHREEDIAMLDLFGVSYHEEIIQGYESVHPLASGFAQRYTLWQLFPIAGHCVFFGGGYINQFRSMCSTVLHHLN